MKRRNFASDATIEKGASRFVTVFGELSELSSTLRKPDALGAGRDA